MSRPLFLILFYLVCIILTMSAQRVNISRYTNKNQIIGIDVSHHTGQIDWNKIKEQGVEFAYIKSTEGTTFLDARYMFNIQKAREAGIKVGAYHFFRFNQSGQKQADFYLSKVDVLNLDLPPVIDVEEDDWINNAYYNRAIIIQEIKSFIHHIQNLTYRKVMIYANLNAYKKYISDIFYKNPIWITSIGTDPEIDQWHIWQKWHNGYCKGASREVDINIFKGDSVQWNQFLTY